jgi:hypothetical protein
LLDNFDRQDVVKNKADFAFGFIKNNHSKNNFFRDLTKLIDEYDVAKTDEVTVPKNELYYISGERIVI